MLGLGIQLASRDARVAQLHRQLQSIEGEAAMVAAAGDVRRLAFELLEDGESAARLTRAIADLNDALTARVLALAAQHHRLDDIRMCWLALGSEGRQEQTVHTDQDNAIVFVGGEAERARLLVFADSANRLLDRCGYRWCPGDIMARNPQWCLSLEEWQACFSDWIDSGKPQALLHGAIFFDFRGLWGDLGLARALREWLSAYIAPRPLFLRQMSQNLLQARPGANGWGRFQLQAVDGQPPDFDIKTAGAGHFSDVARILALSRGIPITATAARLSAWPAQAHEGDLAESWVEAFHMLQWFRLRRQLERHAAGRPLDNRIDPSRLSRFERRLLRAAFAELRGARHKLAVDYGLAF
ncbi:MAG: hypothetical protein K0U79_13135 [Gammaproteobacteria bacterium]|nr:hypothetical protein [Gammaproteobacteria bacterium]